MTDRETRQYEMFNRVQTFGRDNAADFAPDSKAASYFATIAQVIKDIDAAKAGRQGGGATAKEAAASALRTGIQNVVRTARAIAQDEPGFADSFRLPQSPSQTALLTAADAIIRQLNEPGVAAKFIAHELPPDFLQSLADDRQAIIDAEADRSSDSAKGVTSTAAIRRLIGDGTKTVRYLDAIMFNKYTRNPDKLRAWESASHVERPPQHEKKAAPAPAPAPTPAPPSQPT